jgi:pyruvate formate-lyase activating enzyme-like uncharacterized protein
MNSRKENKAAKHDHSTGSGSQTIQQSGHHSWKIGSLSEGCKRCVKGEKLVTFITGVCNNKCFYCPVSEQKNLKDVVFANEWDTKFTGKFDQPLTKKELDIFFEEIRLTEATGCGITGGDPLLVPKRTSHLIKSLKDKFGKGFHIHLYTPLRNVTEEKLAILAGAGLDEIRFHPDVLDKRFWERMLLAHHYKWTIGVEIPALPGYELEIEELVDYIDGHVSFLNLNELEISDTNASDLVGRGYFPKDRISYGVKDSEKAAKHILSYCREKPFSVHYCTCKLKDAVQMAQRIKRRAKNARLQTDKVTKEGMLVRGVIYLKETAPLFSYRKKAKMRSEKQKKSIMKKLKSMESMMINELKVAPQCITIDDHKLRLLTSEKIIRLLSPVLKKKGYIPAIVEEYPTWDGMEVEVEML